MENRVWRREKSSRVLPVVWLVGSDCEVVDVVVAVVVEDTVEDGV